MQEAERQRPSGLPQTATGDSWARLSDCAPRRTRASCGYAESDSTSVRVPPLALRITGDDSWSSKKTLRVAARSILLCVVTRVGWRRMSCPCVLSGRPAGTSGVMRTSISCLRSGGSLMKRRSERSGLPRAKHSSAIRGMGGSTRSRFPSRHIGSLASRRSLGRPLRRCAWRRFGG